ncbi:hypothetical protein DCAR_0206215 [Daucus carota subsp. sativus]|uniref:Uncharacterized protein n=1 Tax=Daucus carota subsp. sativus TaxID=79200 RepID=A0A166D3T7_DAUCS|nr:hypothetical protein DCAR_0206215 [Daucus carota subsp. sativus]
MTGGSYPAWNEKLDVQMTMHVHFLNIDVQCKVSASTDRFIGRARIPASDFTGPQNYLHILSYNMERNGIINFSIRIKASGARRRITPMAASKVSNYGMDGHGCARLE